jgi:hypothetical protein
MNVTPRNLQAIYDLLSVLPPFDKWRLPESSLVTFQLLAGKDHAEYSVDDRDRLCIAVNPDTHITLNQLVESVAHEMVHLRQDMLDRLPAKEPHNAEFRRWAKAVCVALGFDVQRF